MKRKVLTSLVALTVTAGLLTGCGGSGGDTSGSSSSGTASSGSSEAAGGETSELESGGKVLNIWCWNDEFQSRFNQFYPEVKDVASDKSTTTLKDGTTVRWTINANKDNLYQDKLDEALLNQESAAADDKIDIFLMEADYIRKYTSAEADVAVPLSDLGITDDDLADQYAYTRTAGSDENGVQRATSWQATPGLFAYRRSIAKDVLGTDDPEKVQEALSDWDKFTDVAEKAKAKGYKMVSGYDDTYRTFSNNVSSAWSDGTKIVVDPALMEWVDQTKDFTDKKYNNKSVLWDDQWNNDQGADAKVFGFFYSTWGINFTLVGNAGDEGVGDWAVCYGPAKYFWGGSWFAAAKGTDNADLIKDIMLKLTCDKDIMVKMTTDEKIQDYTNTISGMEEVAGDPKFSSKFLGGQNHIALFSETAPDITMDYLSIYDQGCNELFQTAFHDYFNGNVDLEGAKANFETAIKEKYPDITEVVWP